MICNVTLLLTSDDPTNSSSTAKECPALHNLGMLCALLRHVQSSIQLHKLVHPDRGDFPTVMGAEIRALDPTGWRQHQHAMHYARIIQWDAALQKAAAHPLLCDAAD